jgi:hypothetical protein
MPAALSTAVWIAAKSAAGTLLSCGMLPAVPEAPPAVAAPPLSFSVSSDCVSGTALPSTVTFCSVVLSTFRSALTWTRALLGPSVWSSSASIEAWRLRS